MAAAESERLPDDQIIGQMSCVTVLILASVKTATSYDLQYPSLRSNRHVLAYDGAGFTATGRASRVARESAERDLDCAQRTRHHVRPAARAATTRCDLQGNASPLSSDAHRTTDVSEYSDPLAWSLNDVSQCIPRLHPHTCRTDASRRWNIDRPCLCAERQ